MNSLQMIIKYWLKSRGIFVKAFILQIISTIAQLIIPIFIGRLVGRLNLNSPNPMSITELFFYFIMIVGLGLMAFLIFRYSRILGARVSTNALYFVRKDIHNAINRQSFAYFDQMEAGNLVARATSDVEQTDMIFGFGLAVGVQGVIQLFGVLFAVLILGTQMIWIFAILIPSSLIISLIITKKLRPIYLESREAFGELTNTIRENIVGGQVVRMFSMQDKEFQKFDGNNKRFYKASVRSVKINSLYMPINFILIGLMTILTLSVGGNLVIQGKMPLSTLITFQSYIGMTTFPLVILGQIMITYVQADAALRRIREVIESSPEILEKPNPISAKNLKGEVEFENVSFGYTQSNRVLKNLTFKVPSGKKIAIIGTTGSGKSTIINLIPRFYDVSDGSIKIDSVDVRDYNITELRHNIAIVSQDTFLFDKTIKENITYGKADATMEEVIEAAKSANIHEFILELPKGYQSMVGERGTRLSGGQKQRLSIARAIILKPKILVFDDSTSSVDVETEYKIQNALERIMKNTTTFIITQRISSIRNANEILVLDKGRIVGYGTHENLIEKNVLYRQIYETLYRKQKVLTVEQKLKTEEVVHE
ncbi:MAG: ABC transporter ATP-binding protein [Promethearchaeota archaeon]